MNDEIPDGLIVQSIEIVKNWTPENTAPVWVNYEAGAIVDFFFLAGLHASRTWQDYPDNAETTLWLNLHQAGRIAYRHRQQRWAKGIYCDDGRDALAIIEALAAGVEAERGDSAWRESARWYGLDNSQLVYEDEYDDIPF